MSHSLANVSDGKLLEQGFKFGGVPFFTERLWQPREGAVTPFFFFAVAVAWLCGITALFGLRLLRNDDERAVVRSIAVEVFPAWASASVWGTLWYCFYASEVLPEGERSYIGLRNTGELTLLGFAVAGLTFASVFGATKAKSRWWEARGHVGRLVAELKYLVGACSRTGEGERVCLLSKAFFASVRMHLHDDAGAMLQDLVSGGEKADAEEEQTTDAERDSYPNAFDAAGVTPSQQRLWQNAGPRQRPMLAWQWLLASCVAMRANANSHQLHESLHMLVEAYHGAAKVKMHSKDRTALQVAEDMLYWMVLVGVLPMSMARSFHVQLSWNLLHSGASLWVINSIPFVLTLSSVVIFFGALRTVANLSADPFGEDATDLKLVAFEKNLFADLELMVLNSDASRSKPQLEKSASVGKLEGTPTVREPDT